MANKTGDLFGESKKMSGKRKKTRQKHFSSKENSYLCTRFRICPLKRFGVEILIGASGSFIQDCPVV